MLTVSLSWVIFLLFLFYFIDEDGGRSGYSGRLSRFLIKEGQTVAYKTVGLLQTGTARRKLI